MATLLIVLGSMLTIGGLTLFPVLAHALLDPLPPRSPRRAVLAPVAVVANLGSAAGGVCLLCAGFTM